MGVFMVRSRQILDARRIPRHHLASQIIMSVLIFGLLGSVKDPKYTKHEVIRNSAFSTAAFVLGALTSILSGYLGMKIATYANARTAVEARKGIAPAFMCGAPSTLCP
jgi:Na+/H+-translocating membrane pyrophosphatase